MTTTYPESGKVCVAGEVLANQWAQLTVLLATVTDEETTLQDFDALGVSSIRFTLESPPTSGVTFVVVTTDPVDCYTDNMSGFIYTSDAGTLLSDEGVVTVPLDQLDFAWGDGGTAFDPTRVLTFNWSVSTPGVFDFCVSSVELLDADGAVISP